MSEMMKAIEEHKSEVKKSLNKTVLIMKQGIAKSEKEQKANAEKMKKRMAEIEKRMEKGDEAAGKNKEMIEQLQRSMVEITESVEMGQEQQKKAEKELAALQEQIEGNLENMEKNMVTADQMDELQGIVLKVNSKVGSIEAEIDREASQREADMESISKRVTANEEELDATEEALDSVDSDIGTLAEIMADISAAQKDIKDEAVRKVMEEVSATIKETTKKATEEKLKEVEEEADLMVGSISKGNAAVEEKLKKEKGERSKQDKKIQMLQSQVSALLVQLEQKSDEKTVTETEEMVTVLQEQIRKQKSERSHTETEILLMKQEMQKMEEKIAKEENVVEHYYSEMHTIEEYYNEIHQTSTRTETNIEQQEQINAAQSKIKNMKTIMSSFNEKMKEDEEARMASQRAMSALQEQTRSLFQKTTMNAQR